MKLQDSESSLDDNDRQLSMRKRRSAGPRIYEIFLSVLGYLVHRKCASSISLTRCFALRFLRIVERHFCDPGLAYV
jgi:hypothetical protein